MARMPIAAHSEGSGTLELASNVPLASPENPPSTIFPTAFIVHPERKPWPEMPMAMSPVWDGPVGNAEPPVVTMPLPPTENASVPKLLTSVPDEKVPASIKPVLPTKEKDPFSNEALWIPGARVCPDPGTKSAAKFQETPD